ncbi:zinc finger protein GLIS2 [Lethenteron reissneri]|uniref:zinc finger protein GLIS2 n=1 Tax=Lethenteron reissneri TaxID=7753 RepID=UPI002AB6923B|nr:zinc finger protein GLIS2 [Lethenteron reissneri]
MVTQTVTSPALPLPPCTGPTVPSAAFRPSRANAAMEAVCLEEPLDLKLGTGRAALAVAGAGDDCGRRSLSKSRAAVAAAAQQYYDYAARERGGLVLKMADDGTALITSLPTLTPTDLLEQAQERLGLDESTSLGIALHRAALLAKKEANMRWDSLVLPLGPDDTDFSGPLTCHWKRCQQVFDSQQELVEHVHDAHVRADREVGYCCHWEGCARMGRGFNARYKMLIHVRTHTNEKPHQCPICNKSFSRLENLKIHGRSHTGEKPYACPYQGCSKRYSNSSDRFKHTRTHYVDKPYACKTPGCLKRYTDPSSLRKHVKAHGHQHGPSPDAPMSGGCPLSSSSSSSSTTTLPSPPPVLLPGSPLTLPLDLSAVTAPFALGSPVVNLSKAAIMASLLSAITLVPPTLLPTPSSCSFSSSSSPDGATPALEAQSPTRTYPLIAPCLGSKMSLSSLGRGLGSIGGGGGGGAFGRAAGVLDADFLLGSPMAGGLLAGLGALPRLSAEAVAAQPLPSPPPAWLLISPGPLLMRPTAIHTE